MIRAAACALLLAASLSGVAAEAGDEDGATVYSLEDCIRIGLERSAAAANAARDREIADTRITQARSEAVPGIALSAGYTRLDELQEIDLGDEVTELGSLNNYELTAEVNQLLYSGGRVKAALKAAGQSREYADWSKAETEAALVRDVRVGFYDILFAAAAVEVRRESVAQLTALLEQSRDKFGKGTASEFEALTSEVGLANEKPRLIRAVNTHELAVESFRKLINLDEANAEFSGELVFEPFQADEESVLAEALANRAALRAAEAVVRLRREDLTAARSGMLPDLRAYFLYSGANSYRFVSFDDQWEWHWNAGLVFNWPLWDGGLTVGKVREKRLQVEKSRTNLEDLERAVRLEVRRALLDLRYAEQAAASGRDNVALAEKAMAIAKTRYDAGLATRLDVSDANLALNTARLNWRLALRDHMAARAELDYARGRGVEPPQPGEDEE